jgi:AcrR family transcriptional regulator
MSTSSPEAIANALFTQIVKDLRANDVSIADIARAAGVTHRAISRRLKSS